MRCLLFLCVLLVPLAARAQGLTVFAAASLTDAMKDIAKQWTQAGHPPLQMSFASSSTLAQQIAQGAPANVFASADEKWMDFLAQKNLIVADTRKDLLGNDLVLVVPTDKPLHVTIGPGFDLLKLLGPNGRLSVGDPAHVPAGIYAEQALKKLGWWDSVSPRLASAEDVRAALLLVERGEAPAGIVYGTDAAVSKAVMVAGTFPASSHDPVAYPFALVKAGDTPDARALLKFLAGPQARAVFVQRGFKVE
ncbi:MAG TPA: molybdate ABC transporter substrate-binding protein [Acetobacteraceae bacterium]|jgi:molybdate transport system substrate-binding protein|nr:molybdate ABC transporter substrate-binding protein [Acetobacteraceae bacterium]